MKEMFTKIFSNPNFPYIIGGIIAALTIIFIIVWLLGKKDKKKIEATQAIPTVADANLNANNTLDPNLGIKPAEESVLSNGIPEPEALPVMPEPVKESEPSALEYIPEINPDEIPDTPKEEMYTAPEVEDEEVYRSSLNENTNEIKEDNIPRPFDPSPEIEPYIPETSVQNFQKVAEDIEKDLNVIESMTPNINVAPVEVITSEAQATNPMPVSENVESLDSLDVTPQMPSTPVFSAVNPPNASTLDDIELPKMK